jgi:hypothetical protein
MTTDSTSHPLGFFCSVFYPPIFPTEQKLVKSFFNSARSIHPELRNARNNSGEVALLLKFQNSI